MGTAPIIWISAGALLMLLVEVLSEGKYQRLITSLLLVIGLWLVLPMTSIVMQYGSGTAWSGVVYVDLFSSFFSLVIIGGTLISLWISKDLLKAQGIVSGGEYYALLLMCVVGCLIFVSSAELITLFVGLEIMSMALYALCGSATSRRNSLEAALKYFLLGSFSSAFLLYGIALLYGLTGSTEIATIAAQLNTANQTVTAAAVGLILVGMVFKIGLAPFHFWTPDVYQGSPTSITAFMACVVKATAFGASLRLFWVLFGDVAGLWEGVIWFIAVLTMVIGSVVALQQRSLKRMLAYSSIGHAGFICMAFLASQAGGGAAILYYLVAYVLMTLGAFGVVLAATAKAGDTKGADDITRMNGFGYSHPFLAILFTLFLLSMAGIPPGMAGLLGKFYVFNSVIQSGYVGLAIIGVLCAAISCYYYLRVIVAMYFIEPTDGDSLAISIDSASIVVLTLCALGVVVFGVFPSLIHEGAVGIMAQF
jgi:NADH-quinone oxidoreductase subunit N